MRAGIDSISINPDATVFTRKLVVSIDSIEQMIMLEKALMYADVVAFAPLIPCVGLNV